MAKKINQSVAVVVTVLNEAASIQTLLAALVRQTFLPSEIIIVDGGSTDATVDVMTAFQHATRVKIRAVVHPGNRSVGRNIGVSLADSHWIAFTDAGCVPHDNWLEELMAAAGRQPGSGDSLVVAGYYDAVTRTPFEQAVVPYVLVMPDRVNPDTFLPATRSMLITRSLFKQLGGFDERLADNEDYALAQKIAILRNKHQLHLVFAPHAKVSWIPRSSLPSFTWMIYRFARGDIDAGIIRPKVILVFARYLGMVGVIAYLLARGEWVMGVGVLTLSGVIYSGWSITKNYRYVPQGWYWLPILQFTADAAVLAGSVAGFNSYSLNTYKHIKTYHEKD